MSGVSGGYQLTLPAHKTGMYRLTCRWRLTTDPAGTYRYYTDPFGDLCFRAHAVVVSPSTSRDMVMYELNALNVEAEGTLEAQRSTFVDLWDGPGSTRTARWNLAYARGLGVNWLWFQPVHPYGIDGRHLSAANINARANPGAPFNTRLWNGGAPYDDVNYPYALGSPYAVKNFFAIEPRMSKANNRAAALTEFQDFVAAADSGGLDTVNVMLDAAFNHTAWDVELGAPGVTYFSPTAQPTDEIRNREARAFSRDADGLGSTPGHYAMRAFSAGSIALAADRTDFDKFIDTFDIYWGRYAALVPTAAQSANIFNEGDWFDYSIGSEGSSGDNHGHFDTVTQNVWRYFADYLLHWLDQTGCVAGTSPGDQAWKGVDGLRADFAQGLPPQAWEYMVNRTRVQKWAFVFMAESLDGGAVTYRSSRHFDVLNENIVFAVAGANVASNNMTSTLRGIFESRRASYGQSMVLLNTVSHDEQNAADPWEALLRFAVYSTIDGVPMIFCGQELGISTTFGFDVMDYNANKYIPHFKTYNSMMPLWTNTDFGNDQLYPVYSAISQARRGSPALKSSNRYYLDQVGGFGTHQRIFSVAKYETPNAPPGVSDVVFGFINLDRGADRSGFFNVNITQSGSNLFGIQAGRTYNVRNLAAYTAQDATRDEVWLWGPSGRTGSDVLSAGVFAGLNRVPTTNGAWTTAPFEAQYLKLYDVTPPPVGGAPGTPKTYALGTSVTFSWSAAGDPLGGIAGYRVIVSTEPNGGGTVIFDGQVSVPMKTVTGALGQTLYATVKSINNAGIESTSTSPSVGGTILLDPLADQDGDGASNEREDDAGTNPLDAASVFRITQVTRIDANTVQIVWASVAGKSYVVESTDDLGISFLPLSGAIPATGAATTYSDPTASVSRRFYRVTTGP